jgi:hypothetical protein
VLLLSHALVGCGGGGAGGGGARGEATGIVKDLGTHSPIQGATVIIGGLTGVTGPSGSYHIQDIPTGQQSVACSALGYTAPGPIAPYNILEGVNYLPDIYLIADTPQPPPPPPI